MASWALRFVLAVTMVSMSASLVVASGKATVTDAPEHTMTVPVAGGWTPPRTPSEEDVMVWDKVVAQIDTKLASKGQPKQVESQVVAGIKYKFFFDDGSSVVVLSVPWMKTLEVLEAKDSEPKDA